MTDQNSSQSFTQVTVEEFTQRLATADNHPQLIDVREPQEIDIASINGFINLPLSEFTNWSDQIHSRFDSHTETFVLCHHGIRSAQMCQWLVAQGFTNVNNIAGGIAAYSTIVDSSVPQY
jgi:rhodanese-related sulfurtransferase